MERLDAISGVNRTTIENVVAEIGADMSQFPDEHHLSSWAGISPGNEESAGKRLRNRTTRKNRWLRRAIIEAAWAAGRTKNSYLGAQYRRLAARRGKKRALIAVGHSMLVIFYPMLKYDVEYQDLGVDYFDERDPEHLRHYLVKRLERLGYQVSLTPQTEAAELANTQRIGPSRASAVRGLGVLRARRGLPGADFRSSSSLLLPLHQVGKLDSWEDFQDRQAMTLFTTRSTAGTTEPMSSAPRANGICSLAISPAPRHGTLSRSSATA